MKQYQERPYQQRVIAKATDGLITQLTSSRRKLYASSLISSPPGSGKTYMGLSVINNILNHLGNHDLIVGWCAMRRTLLQQAEEENRNSYKIKNFIPTSIFDQNPPKCDILMFDEAHHSVADSAINLLAKINPKMYIGLSATPYRTDGVKLNFADTVMDASYRALIRDGHLAQFDQYILEQYTVETMTDAYLRFRKLWGKSVAFFLTIDECERAAAIVRAAGVRASVVTHKTDVDEEVRKFRAGETEILFNVFTLVEGFDCPELRTVFVRDSSKGPTIQMAGRGLRTFMELDGKWKVANLVQSRNSKNPFDKFADARSSYTMHLGDWLLVKGKSKFIDSTIKVNTKLALSGGISPGLAKLNKMKKGSAINMSFMNDTAADPVPSDEDMEEAA